MSFRPKIKIKGKRKPTNGSVLDLQLFHGDIVVMHGTEIHRYYEVSLSEGYLIAACTGILTMGSIE